ncbi:hypothetical protein C0992_002316 [Termitomyces sp. T32_za158]|nr:hypothetical protein C0992_002316 [Termitomyces sp. T32_za158]
MAAETLAEYVASQDELLQEAALALPHEFSKCTYSLGHIRPTSRKSSPVPHSEESETHENQDDDAQSEVSSGLPPGLISGAEYESFICGPCVSKNTTLVRWAGTPGITMVVRDTPAEPWRRLLDKPPPTEDPDPISITNTNTADEPTVGSKRPLSPSNADCSDAKRLRGSFQVPIPSNTYCLAPDSNIMAQKIYQQLDAPKTASLGTGDLFLSGGFRDRWCRCSSCLPPLEAMTCLLVEEETYEPPEDPDSGLSLEELGMRALERLPRDKAIDGIHAFNGMRDDLVKYLRPFAQEGKVVSENDVRDFFASLTEAAKKGRR